MYSVWMHRIFSWKIVLPLNKRPDCRDITKGSVTIVHHLYCIKDISFSLATPCPKCPKQRSVSYSKRYVYLFHCSRSFHDSWCSACLTWAHVNPKCLQKLHFGTDNHWSDSDAGPLQDGILCMYEANGASQARHPRRASHASQIQKGLLPSLPEAARCFRSTICCCLLAKKIKLTPLKNFCSSKQGLLTGTSWNLHICSLQT